MIARIKLLWKSYPVCSDVNEKYDIRQAWFSSSRQEMRLRKAACVTEENFVAFQRK